MPYRLWAVNTKLPRRSERTSTYARRSPPRGTSPSGQDRSAPARVQSPAAPTAESTRTPPGTVRSTDAFGAVPPASDLMVAVTSDTSPGLTPRGLKDNDGARSAPHGATACAASPGQASWLSSPKPSPSASGSTVAEIRSAVPEDGAGGVISAPSTASPEKVEIDPPGPAAPPTEGPLGTWIPIRSPAWTGICAPKLLRA